MASTFMRSTTLTIDRTSTPAAFDFSPNFNAADWFIDRHVHEGRGANVAIREVCAPDGVPADRDGPDRGGAHRAVTYDELADRVNRAGNALRDVAKPGDRVLMVVKDCAEFFYLFWGAIKAGVIPVPVNAMLRRDGLAFMIADAAVRAVIYSPEFASEAVPALVKSGAGAQGLVLDAEGGFITRIDEASPELDAVAAGPDEVAFWLYSSGTTGRPKGVIQRHRAAPVTCEHYGVGVLGLGEDDACFSAARLFFAYGLGNAMTFPLHVGGTAILDERRPTPATTFETIERTRPTAYFGVPTLYAAQLQSLEQLEESDDGGADTSSLRLCVSAGEALPADIFRRWHQRTGLEILDGIGSTEALHIFISNAPGAVKPGTTGRLVPGYDARILTESGVEATPGEAGQLEIRGESVMSGYWNRPETTAATLVGGWLRTGDQYVRDDEGYFQYQGRADDMMKVGGIWCSPFDIEARLIEHPAVLEAAVVGRADDQELVKPEAFVVLTAGVTRDGVGDGADEGGALEAALIEHCQEGLPRYMYPRWIHFVDDLPKTATGKIQRFKLRT
ncbi:MAG: benzoate-CoA ligase family protein [Gemmatimonadota bacterium]